MLIFPKNILIFQIKLSIHRIINFLSIRNLINVPLLLFDKGSVKTKSLEVQQLLNFLIVIS